VYASRAKNPLRARASLYSMTVDELEVIMARNDGKCEICQERPASNIDHCHNTGKVRGYLCRECNIGLGLFLDRKDFLERAVEYLG